MLYLFYVHFMFIFLYYFFQINFNPSLTEISNAFDDILVCLVQPLKSIQRLQQSFDNNSPFSKPFWEILLNDTRLQQACNKGKFSSFQSTTIIYSYYFSRLIWILFFYLLCRSRLLFYANSKLLENLGTIPRFVGN